MSLDVAVNLELAVTVSVIQPVRAAVDTACCHAMQRSFLLVRAYLLVRTCIHRASLLFAGIVRSDQRARFQHRTPGPLAPIPQR